MENRALLEYNKKRKIFQLGVVVANLEDAMNSWISVFKVGPWLVKTLGSQNLSDLVLKNGAVREQSFKYRIALAMIGDLQIELLEANAETPIYMDFLKRTGGGIHHIKEMIGDERMDSELASYESIGVQNIFGANYYHSTFNNLDAVEKLGVFIEIGNCATAAVPAGESAGEIYPRENCGIANE